MDLKSAVKRYLETAGGFGRPMPLAAFGLSTAETEKVFSEWDEDYQISRYMELSLRKESSASVSASGGGGVFTVNAVGCTHVVFRAGIEPLLENSQPS